MGWIGKAIDALVTEIAPDAGRRRVLARSAAHAAMNYDGASRGRRTYGWKSPATDGDAAAFGMRARLRQLSRDMIRNRPYAARAREVVVSNVVGTGIVPSVVHADPDKQAAIMAVIEKHLLTPALDARGELDFYAMQEVVIGTVFTDGEVLARRRIRRGKYARDLPLGFQVELLEADHLDDTVVSWGDNEVIEGVEYSPIGDIEAYHLFDEHPGAARMRGLRLKSRRVPWQDVLHIRRLDRPGQLRGVPWLAPVMMTLGEISDYQEAQILKQKMAALMAVVVTTSGETGAKDRLRGLDALEPGAIVAVPEGASVNFTTPPRVDDYQPFMREALGAIAMGIGITRESLTGDLSGVNFSSGRMGRMEMDRNVERWQRLVISQFCTGVERWVREAWPLQRVERAEPITLAHTAPRRPLIDPNDEIDAFQKQIDGGLNSRQNVQRTLGLDPERIRRERAEDIAKDADAKLAPPGPANLPNARETPGEGQTRRGCTMKRRGTDLIIGGELVLSGYVMSDESAAWAWEEEIFFSPAMVREALLAMGEGRITIRLNSGGGDPVAGEAIRATLAGHPGGCTIIVEGQASSAASLIFMGGTERQMTSGSFIMLHNPSAYVYGSAEQMRAQADFLDMLARSYARVYADRSGQSVEAVMAIMAAETFYTAEAAIEAGFADAIAADAVTPAVAPPLAEMRLAMRNGLQTYVALMRDKAPARGDDRAPRNPAPVAATMERPMPNDNPNPAPVNPPAPNPDAVQAAMMAERNRVTMIQSMARPYVAAGRLTDADVQALVDDGTAADMAGSRFMATMAQREPTPGAMRVTERGRDETETRRIAMEGALTARLTRAQPEEVSRQYMDYSIVDMAAERLGHRRVPGNFAAREEVLRMAFHSTSDFPALLENAMNRSLAARYALAQPTYRRIARQRTYVDFRDHNTVRVGDFPNLQPVNPESGELKSGSFSESKEKTAVKAYGVQVLFSRQLLVNDSLDGIQQILNDRGAAVARFEDATFYAMMLGGSNADGPNLNETSRQMFNTTDKTKAAAGGAISVSTLSDGRAALRKRKSMDGAELELSAAILLCGPDKETEAQQVIAPIQAQQAGNVNPFAGTLTNTVTAKITGNAWYLFASPEEAACFEWGLLEGYTAPRFRMEDPFGVQGTKFSLEHDFGCGAIDYRGGWKNPGN